MKLSTHIRDLLIKDRMVVIPKLGAFIVKHVPAKVTGKEIIPPSKEILFNASLKSEDEALLNYICKTENVSKDQANELIKKFVDLCIKSFREATPVDFPGLGILSYDEKGKFKFKVDSNSKILNDAFGLPRVEMNVSKKETPTRVSESIEEQRTPSSAWALLIIIPVLLLVGWWELKTNIIQDLAQKYVFEKEKNIEVVRVNEHVASAPVISEPETIVTEPAIPLDQTTVKEQYYIVAGAFKEIKNAQKLVKELKEKGFNAEIIGQTPNGLYRVSFNFYVDRSSADAQLTSIRSTYNRSAWVLKK